MGIKQVDSDGEKGCFVSVREGLIDEVMFEQRPERNKEPTQAMI